MIPPCLAPQSLARRKARAAAVFAGADFAYRPTPRRMDRDPAAAQAAEAAADLLLVRAALAGDEAARHQIVDRLATLPARIRARHVRFGGPLGPDQLEDVAQNVLLLLWQKLALFDGRAPLRAWALGFASFELLKAIGRARRDRARTTELPDLVDERRRDELAETDAFAQLLAALPTRDYELLRLKHVEGLTLAEIAARWQLPLPNIKTRYYRALDAVRRRSDADDEGKNA